MIIDKVDGQNIPRYLVYDVVAFEGFDVGKQPFYPNRLMLIEVSILNMLYILCRFILYYNQKCEYHFK